MARFDVTVDRKDIIRNLDNAEDLKDTFQNWEKVSIADSSQELKRSIEKVARSRFDYDGTRQLNDKPDQVALSDSIDINTSQLRKGGKFASGLTAEINIDAPHARALESGSRPHLIRPRMGKDALRFAVPANNDDGMEFVTVEYVNHPGNPGYHYVRDGVYDYIRKQAGEVKREVIQNTVKSGYRPGR